MIETKPQIETATHKAAAHTPGPWNIDGSFDAEIAVAIYAGDMLGDWNGICELEPFLEDWTPEEIANAHLIAAAPDLLKACRVVKAFLDGLEEYPEEDDPLTHMRRKVHAPLRAALEPAIAKAEGRALEAAGEKR